MTTKQDGGPAFPGFGQIFTTDAQGANGAAEFVGMEGAPGMSLRDYFAAQAMPALISEHGALKAPELLGKDIENRDWPTKFRGAVLIHAAKGVDRDDREDLTADMQRGGIIGAAEVVDCVTASTSRWFSGKYGFVLASVVPLIFIPCKGALSFFRPDLSGFPLALSTIGKGR